MSQHDHTFVVILAGGGGTRLWPKSREKTPKQFLKLYSDNTLIQDTFERAKLFVDASRIIVVSNKEYVEQVKTLLPELPIENIVGEPSKRETAAAMFLGALLAMKKDPEAIVVNLASDHVVTNPKEFQRVIGAAVEASASGEHLVTVGILPTFPHSGLGYIKIDDEMKKINKLPIFKVSNFTEKPNTATAKAFISTGRYFWNANNYVWKADALVKAFEKYQPPMHALMMKVYDAMGSDRFATVLQESYDQYEKISIDYAISEKADNLVLIPGDFGWNDIGDWKVVYDLQEKGDDDNVVLSENGGGQFLSIDSEENLVHTNGRLVALVGVEDFIVIDTEEILMIIPKERSQDVKKIVEKLKEQGQKQYL